MTVKHQMFAEEYIRNGLNGPKALAYAGITTKCPNQMTTNYLKHPEVRAYIAMMLGDKAKKLGVSADRVLQELIMIAFADIADYIKWDGDEMQISSLEELEAAGIPTCTIKEMVQVKNKDGSTGLKLRFHSKDKALQLLTDVMQMSTQRVVIDENININVRDRRKTLLRKLDRIAQAGDSVENLGRALTGGVRNPRERLEILGEGQPVTPGHPGMVRMELNEGTGTFVPASNQEG